MRYRDTLMILSITMTFFLAFTTLPIYPSYNIVKAENCSDYVNDQTRDLRESPANQIERIGLLSIPMHNSLGNHSPRIFGPLPVSDSYINTQQPIIGAYFEPVDPGDIIDVMSAQLYLDTILQKDAQVSDTGIVIQPAFPINLGKHSVIVYASILGGNTSSIAWNFTVDLSLPELTLYSPSENLTFTSMNNLTISGKASGIGGIVVEVNKTIVKVDNQGNFTLNIALMNNSIGGANEITISATSKAGNIRYANRTIIRDNLAPRILLLTLNATGVWGGKNYTNQGYIEISGNIDLFKEYSALWDIKKSKIKIQNSNQYTLIPAQSDGSFQGSVGLSPGMNTLIIEAIDNAENVDEVMSTVICDMSIPVIQISSQSSTNTGNIVIKGVVTDYWGVARVLVNGKDAPIDAKGSFNTEISLNTLGRHNISLIAIDHAGNIATKNIVVEYLEATIPSVMIVVVFASLISVVGIIILVFGYQKNLRPLIKKVVRKKKERNKKRKKKKKPMKDL